MRCEDGCGWSSHWFTPPLGVAESLYQVTSVRLTLIRASRNAALWDRGMRFREGQTVAHSCIASLQPDRCPDLSVPSPAQSHHGLLDTADVAALEEFHVSPETAGNTPVCGQGRVRRQPLLSPTISHLFSPRSSFWSNCCGLSSSSSSWWLFATPTRPWSTMNVSPPAARHFACVGEGRRVPRAQGSPVHVREPSPDRQYMAWE